MILLVSCYSGMAFISFICVIPTLSLSLSSRLSQVKKRRAVLGVDMAESEEPSSDQFLSNKAASLVYQQAVTNIQRALCTFTDSVSFIIILSAIFVSNMKTDFPNAYYLPHYFQLFLYCIAYILQTEYE